MRRTQSAAAIFFFAFAAVAAGAQALPTATQPLALSAFGGATGSYIGLDNGKNIGITAGVDLRILSYHHFLPSLEIRGTKPISDGNVASEENAAVGLKVEHIYGRSANLHPYVDFLFGRGKIIYAGYGHVNTEGTQIYQTSVSNILSAGGGLDLDISHHFALKLDAQIQRYEADVTKSGKVWGKPITVGVVYRFDFNHHPRQEK